jgi:hypothetical protein
MQSQNNQGNNKGGLSWSQPARTEGGFKPAGASKPTPQPAASKAPVPQPAPEQPKAKFNTALWVGGGIVLGLILGSVFFGSDDRPRRGGPAVVVTPEDTTPAATEEEAAGESASPASPAGTGLSRDSFVVPPTQPAGRTVAVSQVNVSGNVWIVVYESRNGERGNALGAGLFFPGQSSGTVHLLRGTVAGQTYFVGHHRDNGDRFFSLEKDVPVLGSDGEPLYVQFVAQ